MTMRGANLVLVVAYFFSLGRFFGAGFWACPQFVLPLVQPIPSIAR